MAGSKVDATTTGGATAFSTVTESAGITVTGVNDAPTIAAPPSIGVTEDVASPITGISFADVDAGGASVQATFTPAAGSLAATSGGGVTVNSTATDLILTGSIANINAFIAAGNITFTTAPNDASPVNLTVALSDLGNSGSGGALGDSTSITLAVSNVNDPPVVNNQSFATPENTADAATVGTVLASDADVGDTLTYSITAGNIGGAFSIDAATGEILVANSAAARF